MATKDIIDEHISESRRATITRLKEQLATVATAIRRDRLARIGLIIMSIFLILTLFGPQLAPYDPNKNFVTSSGAENLEPPSLKHPFGTNHVAQDVFSQWIYGARVSVGIGLTAGILVMVIGSTVGLISGYYKGIVDILLMRLVDILYGLPAIPLVLVLALFLGNSVWNVLLAFALVLWRTMARIIRSQTLTLSERPFVKAAKATGASDFRIIYLHIAPNLLPLMFIEATIISGSAIALEAGISFLGYGASEMISWGTMLQMSFVTGAIRTAWWWVLPPGISITLVVVSFFFISRGLEAVTNPEVER